jgi:hypothetical protein
MEQNGPDSPDRRIDIDGSSGVQAGDHNVQYNDHRAFSYAGPEFWARPTIVGASELTVVPAVPQTLELRLNNPFPRPRAVIVLAHSTLADVDEVVREPQRVVVPSGRMTVPVIVSLRATDPAAGERVEVTIDVHTADEYRRHVGETTIGVTAGRRSAVTMGVAVREHGRTATFAVRIRNVGNTRLDSVCVLRERMPTPGRQHAVDGQPLALDRGAEHDVTFTLPRAGTWPKPVPVYRPYVHLEDRWQEGPLMTASRAGASARRLAQIAAAVLTVAVIAVAYNGDLWSAEADPKRTGAGASSSTPADIGPLPADAIFDAPADRTGDRRPILVSREGRPIDLEPGGPVEIAVKVPSGWVLRRETGTGVKTVLHVSETGVVTPIAEGGRVRFWVGDDGEGIVVDDRPGTGAGRLVAHGHDGKELDSTEVPAGTVVVDWVADGVLLRYPRTGALDYWWPGEKPYSRTPGEGRGRYLGRVGADAIAVVDGSGCLTQLTRKQPLAVQVRRCGPLPGVDGGSDPARWSALSPDGAFAVPGKSRLYLGHVGEVLRGGRMRATDLRYEVSDLEWIDGGALAVLTEQTPGLIWSCRVAESSCVSVPAPAYEGLVLTHLVARQGSA